MNEPFRKHYSVEGGDGFGGEGGVNQISPIFGCFVNLLKLIFCMLEGGRGCGVKNG